MECSDRVIMRKNLNYKTLTGIWCALQIPFNQNESIDYSCLGEELSFLTSTTVEGIYSCGTAGEFYNLDESEFDLIHELMASHCHQSGFSFQIGASHMSPLISMDRIMRTKSLHPDAYQIILPDWMRVNENEQASFIERMAEVAYPIPLVLYNPGHAKTLLTPRDFKRLSEVTNQLIGIKVGAGGAEWYHEIRELDADLSVFVPGHRLATGVNEGVASGSYANVACISPDGAHQWYEIILEDMEEGLRIEKVIFQFFEQYIMPYAKAGYSDAALDKLLSMIGGRISMGTKVRWPYQSISEKDATALRKEAKRMLPGFFNLH